MDGIDMLEPYTEVTLEDEAKLREKGFSSAVNHDEAGNDTDGLKYYNELIVRAIKECRKYVITTRGGIVTLWIRN